MPPAVRRFRELMDDVSLGEDQFLAEMKALGARFQEFEARWPLHSPLEGPGQAQPPMPDLDGIATYFESPEGLLFAWARDAIRLYGYEPGEVIGKSSALLRPSPCLTGHNDDLQQPFSRRVRKDGVLFQVITVQTPVEDGEGTALGCIVQDFRLMGHPQAEVTA
jgi:hypothetical protein